MKALYIPVIQLQSSDIQTQLILDNMNLHFLTQRIQVTFDLKIKSRRIFKMCNLWIRNEARFFFLSLLLVYFLWCSIKSLIGSTGISSKVSFKSTVTPHLIFLKEQFAKTFSLATSIPLKIRNRALENAFC